MKNIPFFLIFFTSLCFGQTELDKRFNKILLDAEGRIDADFSEFGINNQLWAQYFIEAKKDKSLLFTLHQIYLYVI